MKGTTCKYSITKFFIINPSFFGFLSCFLFQVPFSYSCFFSDFKLCFLVQHQCFWFQNKQVRKKIKRRVATKRFFMNLCLQIVKGHRFFGALFWQILIDVRKALQK